MSALATGISDYLFARLRKISSPIPNAIAYYIENGPDALFAAMGEQAKLLLDADADLTPLSARVSEQTLANARQHGRAVFDGTSFAGQENEKDAADTLNETFITPFLDDWRSEAVKDRPYYLSLPVWPNFAVPNNKVDGLLPTCRVLGWDHFVQVMRDPSQNKAKHEIIYRGQRGFEWPLASTLSRQFSDGRFPQDERDELLNYFRLAMRGRGPDLTVMSDEDVWAYGQHVGLATPLLDWSKSPFVSLYFAFAEGDPEGQENHSRAIFCLDMTRLKYVLGDLFIEPRSNDNARLVNQAGLFTLTPSGAENFESYIMNALEANSAVDFDGFEDLPTPEDGFEFPANEIAKKLAPYICKIHIPNVGRTECLAMLRKMNIHYGSLFPDPFGAAQYCNDWLRRKILENEQETRAEGEARRRAEEETRAKKQAEQKEEKQKEANQAAATAAGSSLEERVKEIMLSRSSAVQGGVDPQDWATKVIQNYAKLESVDWVLKDSTRAKVKTELARQLGLLGAGSAASSMANELTAIFEEEYRKKHNLEFDRSNKRGDDLFVSVERVHEHM